MWFAQNHLSVSTIGASSRGKPSYVGTPPYRLLRS
nr:MAG TPA: hypothetical protein [Caudoviricetes sp.]DAJ29662.1 MAG TPA: hypothetical protein [Caudoviricetes sp.]